MQENSCRFNCGMREQVEITFSVFFGSYAQKMVHESEIPVIVVPN